MSPNNDFDIVRRSLQMSPFQTNDYSAGNVLMDPRWTTMSQCYGQQQEMFDLEKRALMHDNTGSYISHKMKFCIMDFFSKFRIWSHSLKKLIMKDIVFCAMLIQTFTSHRTLILSCIMLKNGQTYFKSLSVRTPQDF